MWLAHSPFHGVLPFKEESMKKFIVRTVSGIIVSYTAKTAEEAAVMAVADGYRPVSVEG
jgi:hypothetical protein